MNIEDKLPSLDGELGRLRDENRMLNEELAQCQADKEFVWSLWKRLQVANPDITQAVGMVVQREKEKNELKDRKVLEILQHKDDCLDELQKTTAKQTVEISSLMAAKVKLESTVDKLEAENLDLIKQKAAAQERVTELTTKESETASRQAIRDLDKANLELKQVVQKREAEIERLKMDKEDLSTLRQTQADRIKNLEGDMETVGENYSKLAAEHDEAKALLKKYERDLGRYKQNYKSKEKELEAVRTELSELWQTHTRANENASQQVGLIRQLHSIQRDQKLVMKNQEDAFSMESTNLKAQLQMLQGDNIELKRQISEYKQRINDQDGIILGLKQQLDSTDHLPVAEKLMPEENFTQWRLESLQEELETLKATLTTGGRSRSTSRSPVRGRRSKSLTDRGNSPVRFSPPPSPVCKRAKSFPRQGEEYGETDVLHRKLDLTERKLEDTLGLLHKKNCEMEELRSAHSKRLQRLHCLQRNYKLIKEQLAMMEDEQRDGPRRKKKKMKRSDPKQLQKEDSDAVWNELTYHKNENKNLHTQNMNLQEEVDTLRVKVAHDAATIHELRTCVEQEKEELNFVLEEMEKRNEEEHLQDINAAKKKVAYIESKLRSISKENKELSDERERLSQERRVLKEEIQRLEERDMEHRIRNADMRRELLRLQRELRRRKGRGVGSSRAKQYQRSLNRSISEMSRIFDEFSKDGWEDVTETEETTDATLTEMMTSTTSESLGQAIVTQAHENDPLHTSTPSHRHRTRSRLRPEPAAQRLPRMQPLNDSAVHCVSTRDAALSPIHFLHPSHDPSDLEDDSVSKRDAAVSPIRSQSSRPSPSGHSRQVVTLRKRIQGLQQQVNILKMTKENAVKGQGEAKKQVEQLQAELVTANQRIQSQKLTNQKLTLEVERLRSERDALESQLEETPCSSFAAGHSEQEWLAAQAKIKALTAESARQVASVKQLKEDNGCLEEKLKKAHEKLNHLERDVSQKRTLVDDFRLRLKLAHENAQSDADVLLEAENKMKGLTDANSRLKTQVESFRQRIAAVTKEKYENEDKVARLSEELERKGRLVSDLQRKSAELERTVVAMETSAQEQLHQLANQSEEAIDTAQARLIQANHRLKEFSKFLKVLSHSILNSIRQARQLLEQHSKASKRPPPAAQEFDSVSLKKAQSKACDILNLSLSDIDDILSVSGESSHKESVPDDSLLMGEDKRDKRWVKKWEKLMQVNAEFSVPLAELFMEKIDEKSKLSSAFQVA